MTALIHPGVVTHCWDHLVITLRDEEGRETAFLSLYAIAYSATLGAGHVAFVQVPDGPAGPWSATLTDDLGLGRRQQERLSAMGDERMRAAGPPRAATFEREPFGPDGFGFRIAVADRRIHARWEDVTAPIWVDGQDGGLSDEEDIWAMFVGAGRASLRIDGIAALGTAFLDDVWVPKLGSAFSSAHGAFAEVRVTGRSTRYPSSVPSR